MTYHFFRKTFDLYFSLYNRLEVQGREFIPPTEGFIAVSNHTSYLDPLVLGAAVRRRMTFLAKKELFGIPLVGTFVGSFSVPVDRDRTSHVLIRELVRRLGAGEGVAMFPAGGRDKEGDGSEAGFKRGLGLLARLSNTRILPAYIAGTDESLPVGGKFPRPSKITVRFAPCLDAGKNENDAEQLVLMAMESIRGLRRAVDKSKNKKP
ncbi:MAG: lysophospholipid acyltransferase family protein [Nitrospiraceae bacterium]|nr:lysophospholipid acyltransferase family protein [Nitrospiraceae bacterium]